MTTSLIRQYYGWFNERRLSDAASSFADDADVELIPGEHARWETATCALQKHGYTPFVRPR